MEDWDDYRYFLAVAKHGSLSAAARRLNISQPTVSRRINQLEERLGIRLFDQLPTGMKLTTTPADIVDTAEALEEKAIKLKRRVAGRESNLAGPILITATQTFASFWLARKLAGFSEMYPDIIVTCLAENRTLNLNKREADIAIRSDQPKSSSLIGSRIGYVHCGIYGAKSYLASRGQPKSLDEPRDHLLIDTLDPIARFQQSQDLKRLMQGSEIACRTNCPMTYVALAGAGRGLICTTCYTAAQIPELKRILADQYDKKIELWMLMHADLKGSKRVRLLMDFLRMETRAARLIFSGR